jgi:hypothetical protein
MLVSGLRVLLGTLSMFLALGMIAFAVVFSGRTVRHGRIFMVLGSLVVFVSSHLFSRSFIAPSLAAKLRRWKSFLRYRR